MRRLTTSDLEYAAGEGPFEGLGHHLVEVLNEVQNLRSQVFLGGKTAAADDSPDQDAEPDLHLVQPRAVLRRVDEADAVAGVLQELLAAGHRLQHAALALLPQRLLVAPAESGHQFHQAFRGVDVQLVVDEHPAGLRVRRHRPLYVLDIVLLRSRRLHRRRDHLSGDHVEVADQRLRAVSLVLELPLGFLTGPGLLGWRDALQGLNAGHLIGADGVRAELAIQFRRTGVGGADELHIGDEVGIVFLFGVEPVTDAIRLEIGLVEQTPEVPHRDGLDDAALDDLLGQFDMSPVGEGVAQLFGVFAGHGEDLGQLLSGELARRARPRGIGQQLADGLAQSGGAFQTLDNHQAIKGSGPASPPDADLVAFEIDLGGDLFVEQTGEGQQDDRGPLPQEVGLATRAAEFVKDLLLPLCDRYLGRLAWHGRPRFSLELAQARQYSQPRPPMVARFRSSCTSSRWASRVAARSFWAWPSIRVSPYATSRGTVGRSPPTAEKMTSSG